LLTNEFRFRFNFLLKYLRKKKVDVTKTKLEDFLKEIGAKRKGYRHQEIFLRFWVVEQDTILFL